MSLESNQDQENLNDNLIPSSESATKVEPEQFIDDIDQQPTDNTDLVFTDIVTEDNVEHKKSKAKIIAFATGVLTLIMAAGAIFASCSGGSSAGAGVSTLPEGTDDTNPNEENTDSTTNKSEITVSPDGTEVTVSEYDYVKPLESVVECYGFEKLTDEQQAEIKRLDEMSYEEFCTIPVNDMLKFGYWVVENYSGRIEYIMEQNGINLKYTEQPKTADEFAENYAYMLTLITNFRTITVTGNQTEFTNDFETGKKCGIILDSFSENHIRGINELISSLTNQSSVMKIEYEIEDSAPTEDGMILNLFYKANDTVSYIKGKEHTQQTFSPVTFTDIYDRTITIYTCSYNISDTNPEFIDDIHAKS